MDTHDHDATIEAARSDPGYARGEAGAVAKMEHALRAKYGTDGTPEAPAGWTRDRLATDRERLRAGMAKLASSEAGASLRQHEEHAAVMEDFRAVYGDDEPDDRGGFEFTDGGRVLPDLTHTGRVWDRALVGQAERAATEAGLPDALVARGWAMYASVAQASPVSQVEAVTRLRGRWGEEFEGNLAAAQRAYRKAPAAVRAHFAEAGLEDHPDLVTYFADVARERGW